MEVGDNPAFLVVLWLIASSYLCFNHDSSASWISLDSYDFLSHTKHHPTMLGSSTVLQICQSLLIPEHSTAQHSGLVVLALLALRLRLMTTVHVKQVEVNIWLLPMEAWPQLHWGDAKNLSGSKAKGL